MSGPDAMIVVNDFMFCKQHGSEYCHLCTCDHRDGNNHVLDLYNVFADNVEESGFSLEVRLSQRPTRQETPFDASLGAHAAERIQPRCRPGPPRLRRLQVHHARDEGLREVLRLGRYRAPRGTGSRDAGEMARTQAAVL